MGKAANPQGTLRRLKHVVLVHWKPAEAEPVIQLLEQAGYAVHYNGGAPIRNAMLREQQPCAVVIDLTRMPSHGRYVATGIRATKSVRHIPIVFVDGDPEKVAQIREQLPDATYTTLAKLPVVLRGVKPIAEPIATERLASYTERSVAQKLGIRAGMQVGVFDAPCGYGKLIGGLPDGAELVEEPAEALPLTLWFVSDPDAYQAGLRRMRKWASKSRVWVVYPKGTKSPLTQFTVREGALAMGMVDYKICSIDATWTAMLFTIKKQT